MYQKNPLFLPVVSLILLTLSIILPLTRMAKYWREISKSICQNTSTLLHLNKYRVTFVIQQFFWWEIKGHIVAAYIQRKKIAM